MICVETKSNLGNHLHYKHERRYICHSCTVENFARLPKASSLRIFQHREPELAV